jgi:aerobic carbon-monoxide dehydrogenase medium subunit
MKSFNFHRAKNVADAVAILERAGEGKLLAGGQSLIPVMKLDMAQPSDLISIAELSELKGIAASGDVLTIGAATKHVEVAESQTVKTIIPALAALANHIGDAQVRNRGTLGGSIAHADPAADYPAALVALKASVKTNRRTIPGDAFFTGMFSTALEPSEIVVSVSFKKPEKAAYAKFGNPSSKYAIVGVMVAKHTDGVRVAVTGAGPSVFRVEAMEKALEKSFAPAAIAGITVSRDDLNDEPNASPVYRAHLINVMARRAVQEAR